MGAEAPATIPDPHAGHDMGAAEGHAMTGALGSYAMAREASGTAWQPDSSEHTGIHLGSGDWSFMVHGNVDVIHSWQEKPRGDSKTFVAGMMMGMFVLVDVHGAFMMDVDHAGHMISVGQAMRRGLASRQGEGQRRRQHVEQISQGDKPPCSPPLRSGEPSQHQCANASNRLSSDW